MINIKNTTRIFAENRSISNDPFQTGLNNNDLIIGPSGAGKTTGYVIPNIRQHLGSYIIADTKGNLAQKLTPELKAAGYKVNTLDLTDLRHSCRYNPLDFIRRSGKKYNEQDVNAIASILSPVRNMRDPFWDEASQQVITAFTAFVLEAFPEEEQSLVTVSKVIKMVNEKNIDKLFTILEIQDPDSYAARVYRSFCNGTNCQTTWNCILLFVAKSLRIFDLGEMDRVSHNTQNRFSFDDFGKEPAVLFVNISDTDRSMDPLANIFYYQAFQQLCLSADKCPDSRLAIPVQIILDDFATNVFIPDFDKTISVIRSRNIAASLIIQSISQLYSLYGASAAKTIINNCDHMLYLGGQDLDTADLISARVNKSRETILSMPLDKAYLIERGSKSELVNKYCPFRSSNPDISEPRKNYSLSSENTLLF